MFRERLTRFAAGAVTASLAAMLLTVGGALAATPRADWGSISATSTVSSASPPLSKDGQTVWFETTFQNTDTSTISQLFLNGITDAAVYSVGKPLTYAVSATVDGKASTGCANATPLSCSFRNIKPLSVIQVAVVYQVPADPYAGSASCPFGKSQGYGVLPAGTLDGPALCTLLQWSSNGSPSSDGGTSHGDTWNWYDGVALTTDKDYQGSYVFDGSLSVVQNSQAVGPTNRQATIAFSPANGIPVTVQDGPAANASCNSAVVDCSLLFGEWSIVSVNNGQPIPGQASTLYEFQITFDSSEIPSGLNANNLEIYHTYSGGDEVISTACTFARGSTTPGNAPCLTIQKLKGGDLRVTIWTFHNGGFKGLS